MNTVRHRGGRILALNARVALATAALVGTAGTLGTAPVAHAQAAQGYEIITLQQDDEVKGVAPARPAAPYTGPLAAAPNAPLGMGFGTEVEPNNTTATASPLTGSDAVVRAALFPNGDVDVYSFTANAGDRVYAAAMTSASAGNSTDGQLTLLSSDGTTVIEFDDDSGSFAGLSPSIAGATIPATGTYFLRYNDFTAGTASQRFYELHLRVQSGTPTAEVEPNDIPAAAQALPANGWVSGTRNPAAATEQDWYAMTLNAGDTVFLSLDLNPERDGTVWNGRLGIALFGDAGNQILVVDDPGTGDVSPTPNNPSESFWMTVKDAGTYYAFVDSASAATGGPTATYHLSVTVRPNVDEGVNCTTYTSTNVPQTIGPGTGLVSSTITVPGNPRVADLDVQVTLNHAVMSEIDAHLRSPAGQNLGLFTDIGAAATGGQQQMDLWFDDEAGVTPGSTVVRGMRYKPENNSTAGTASTSGAYRLNWFDGINAGGTWTLDLRDDLANTNGGTLTSWSLRICEAPPPPSCPAGTVPTTVYSTDFEASDGGFTSSGTQNEWQRGLPNTAATTAANPVAAFTTCNSGTNCYKTDLAGTYNASSDQNLLSPSINLAGLQPPVVVTWAQRHQVETANFDRYFVDLQQVGGANPVRLYEWLDPTPISASSGTGNPQENIGGAIGWGVLSQRADSLAGQNVELRFNLSSDSSVQFGGVAVDDISVTACRPLAADLAITKTDGATTSIPGNPITYTITASNPSGDPVATATVADTFPATLTGCAWTCAGAGGGTCPASGSGNINASVGLPTAASVTFTATCTIAASATGTLANTATINSAITDPDPANNSATDTNTLTPQANLGITKTNGAASSTPGTNTVYSIVASNAGPSNAPGSTVTDTFPVACTTVNWTCVGAAGGTCTANGAGNINDVVNLPAGASVTYTATCAIGAAATGTLANTAAVAVAAGVTDPTPGNNSATDTDTLVPTADLAITKTNGTTSVTPGTNTTWTIVASNPGPSVAPGTAIADVFPAACTSVTWTCTGAGGATCATSNGSGNITQTVSLPVGGSLTFSAICAISATASGTLSNTATIVAGAGVTDPGAGNDSATDTDTIVVPNADLSIAKTAVGSAFVAGDVVQYQIVAANAGPGAANGATVTDNFPAGCVSVSWTCTGAGGGTCPASGTGNIAASVNLPAGGSVTFVAQCRTSTGSAGSLVNTATVTPPSGVTDPTPGNASSTVTLGIAARTIPALDERGLLILLLTMLALAGWHARRR
jgi:uncharacterized repeat protein (TIGR01451 family)